MSDHQMPAESDSHRRMNIFAGHSVEQHDLNNADIHNSSDYVWPGKYHRRFYPANGEAAAFLPGKASRRQGNAT